MEIIDPEPDDDGSDGTTPKTRRRRRSGAADLNGAWLSQCIRTGGKNSKPLPVLANDADGDPVQVTYGGATPGGGAQKTVLPGSCGATLNSPSLPVTVTVTIDDGVARAQTTSTVTGVSCSLAGAACTP